MKRLSSIIIVTYNHKQYLKACINSILQQDYPHEIIVVDNCSHDGSAQFIIENFPTVKVIKSSENKGYGAGNNLGVKHAKGEYIVILNPDTIVEDRWLRELIEPIENESGIITTPKILLYDGSAINTCGNINHFTGLTFTRGLGELPDAYSVQEYVSGFSGCCFAMRRKDFLALGGFDENFFTYNEDSELSWRAYFKGFQILFVPTSVIKHDYSLSVPPEKLSHLEKGRYIILKKYLSRRDILLLFPSLLTAEVLTFGYALKHGRARLMYKLKAMKEGFKIEVKRAEGDRANLFKSLSAAIPTDQLTSNRAERILKVFTNKIFAWNFKVVRLR